MLELRGIFPILATPFRLGGELDKKGFERLVDFLLTCGPQGIALFGLAGESYKLNDHERSYLQHVFLSRTQGRVARIVCVSDHSTELARNRAKEAVDAGADALLVMPPFFLSPDSGAVRDHLGEIARAVHVPILVQYAPNLTGLRLSPQFFLGLAQEFPHVQYVKVDGTPAGPVVSRLIEESKGQIKPMVGYAGLQMVDALARGAVGCMPGCSLPEAYLEIFRTFDRGHRQRAAALHGRLLPLINFMMQAVEFVIQCEKTILHWRGIIESDYCRRPGATWTRHDVDSLKELVESVLPSFARETPGYASF